MTDNSNVDIESEESLLAYLRGRRRIGADERPRVRVLAGGVSNKTVLVERESGEAWVLKQALPKLRVAVDWFSSPERIHREALGMRRLGELAPRGTITKLVHEDVDEHIIIMEAVPEPHENWKAMLLRGDVKLDHIRQFAILLATVHSRSHDEQTTISVEFDDRRFFESLRLEPYYGYALTNVPEAQFLEPLVFDTRTRRFALVHGDYSPKNVLIRNGRVILLDHEVVHFGDPAFDVGFALTHLLSKAHHLTECRAAFVRAADTFWVVYRQRLGDIDWDPDLERYAVLHTLGCMLARVAGRSPLEYLTETERACQKNAVLTIANDMPNTVAELINDLLTELDLNDQN